jgi:hypothetical protein
MQAIFTTLLFGNICLKKLAVRSQLDFQQVRYLHDLGKVTEILADTLLFSERIAHLRSSLMTTLVTTVNNIVCRIKYLNAAKFIPLGKRQKAGGFSPPAIVAESYPGNISILETS